MTNPQLISSLNELVRFLPILRMMWTPPPAVELLLAELPAIVAAANSGDKRQLAAVAAKYKPALLALLADLRKQPEFSTIVSILSSTPLAEVEDAIIKTKEYTA